MQLRSPGSKQGRLAFRSAARESNHSQAWLLTSLGAVNGGVRPLDGLMLRDVHQGIDLHTTKHRIAFRHNVWRSGGAGAGGQSDLDAMPSH